MHLSLLLTACLLPLALANPTSPPKKTDDCDWDGKDGHHTRKGCLTDHAANLIVNKFESFFVKIDPAVAKKFLAPDFQYLSDSTNFATPNETLHVPGALTSSSRADFIAQQLQGQSQGAGPGFTTLNVEHSCHTITFRWRLGLQPTAITGIDLIILKRDSYIIERDYSEFNNVALLADFGCKITCGS